MAVKPVRLLVMLATIMAVTSCGGLAPQRGDPVPVEDRTTPGGISKKRTERVSKPSTQRTTGEAPRPRSPRRDTDAPTAGPAALALLTEARTQANAGNDEQAAALLERALRIEPDNPWLWHRLAVLRLQQGEYGQAIACAAKSNGLGAGNSRLLAGNWEVTAAAKEALGDHAGARHARAQRDKYQLGTQ